MEHRFHPFLQVSGHHRLGDAIGHGGDAQRAHPLAVRLVDLHRAHRGRKVGARRHPVPDLVQIVLQVLVEVGDALAIHSRRALILLDLEPGLPDVPLRNIERLVR
jgi:hypothetical protein